MVRLWCLFLVVLKGDGFLYGLVLPYFKLRGEPGWGEVKSGEDTREDEAGKSETREMYVGL